MKNYELIAELSKLPAGDEVSFDYLLDSNEIEFIEDSDATDGKLYLISKSICDIEQYNGRIMLS